MTRFKIVINCGPCQEFIETCLASVKEQSIPDWDAWVTVDPCGDETCRRALLAAQGDSRIRVLQNAKRQYSMHNHIEAIRRSTAEPDDVIVTLDGDDWFADKNALRLIAEAYDKFDCWVTYGSWLSNVPSLSGRRDGLWPAYPVGTTDFRHVRFLGTAVRTWKKWLWDCVRDEDLRGETGQYVRVSEDQMIMIPLLEMCGTARARHIAEPIMTYNKLVSYPADDSIRLERVSNGWLIERRPGYPRLESRVDSRMAATEG